MSKARDNRKKAVKKVKKASKKKNTLTKNKILLPSIFAVIVIAAIFVSVFAISNARVSKYTKTITKDQARQEILGFKPEIANPRALSNPLRVADNFAADDLEKDSKKIGTEVIVFIDNPSSAKSK